MAKDAEFEERLGEMIDDVILSVAYCGDPLRCKGTTKNDLIDFILTEKDLSKAEGAREERERVLDEVITLSDEIESRNEDGFQQWRGFKGLRNSLRDQIQSLQGE